MMPSAFASASHAGRVRGDPRVGAVVAGRWRLERILGTGGMATVYAAAHRNGSRVAIKVSHYPDRELFVRLMKEGCVGNRVDHPGVVRTLDDGVTDDGFPFLVMELLEGETVNDRLDREGSLSPLDAVRIADAVLDVLAAAHACGVVHRDIKPANVFLTRIGEVKLLDFGIARELGRVRRGETVEGAVLGTPAFMAPEQARGRLDLVGARTDIWAVGAMLFSMLTDSDLRFGSAMEKLAAATLPVQPILTIAPNIPPPIAHVIDRALAFDPAHRFASAREMQSALRVALAAPVDAAEPSNARVTTASLAWTEMPRAEHRVEMACGVALLVVIVGIVGVGATPSPPRAFLPPVPAPAASPALSRVAREPVTGAGVGLGSQLLPLHPPTLDESGERARPVPTAAASRGTDAALLPPPPASASTPRPRPPPVRASPLPARSFDPMGTRF